MSDPRRPRAASVALESIGLVVTADCNLRCRYCYQERRGAPPMAWPVARAGLDLALASPHSDLVVSFLGGEPLFEYRLIRRAMRYVARRAASKNVEFGVVTNGTLLSPRRLRGLFAHGCRLTLSFDGVPAAQECRAPGTFQTLDRVLSYLRERHPGELATLVSVNLIVYPPALVHLADSVDYLLAKHVPEITLAPAMGPHPWRKNDVEHLDRQFAKIFEASRRLYDTSGRVPIRLFRRTTPDPTGVLSSFCCGAPRPRSPVVDVDGRMYPCAMLIRSCQTVAPPPYETHLARMCLGRVDDGLLAGRLTQVEDIARELQIFDRQDRKWSSYGRCADCASAGACAVCPVASRKDPRVSDPLQVSDFLCAFNRVALAHRRRFPCQAATT